MNDEPSINEILEKYGVRVKCVRCGEFFEKRQSSKYCSESCREEERVGYHNRYKKLKNSTIIKTDIGRCIVCEKLFEKRRNSSKYCSQNCARKMYEITRKKVPDELNCLMCGQELVKYQQKKYCSRKCRSDHAVYKRNNITNEE